MTDPGYSMTVHSSVLAALHDRGGRLVASFELDARGDTVGAKREGNRPAHCSICDGTDHVSTRCNGPGNPPRPRYQRHRKPDPAGDWLSAAAKQPKSLDAAKRVIAERIAARRGR